MSDKRKEKYWDLQSETLRQIRSDLNNNAVSPTGRYSTSPRRRDTQPLPRLETPPDHPYSRRGSNLRESRYDVVPPVRKSRRNYESQEDDSWGEEEDSDDEEVGYPHVMPVPYPMMVYPAAPMAWPPGKKKSRKKKGKKVRYADRPTFIDHQEHRNHRDDLRYIVPDEAVLRRYGVIPRERRTNPIPAPPLNPLEEATQQFNEDPLFSQQLVEDLIWEDMEEDLVPSVLVDVLREEDNQENDANEPDLEKDHPLYWPAFDSCVDLIDKEVPKLVREIVNEVTGEESQSDLDELVRSGNMDTFLDEVDSIIDEVVDESAEDVAREISDAIVRVQMRGIRELAENHLKFSAILGIIEDMCDEIIKEDAEIVADSAVETVAAETALDEEVVDPVVKEMAREVAMETLEYYSNKFRRKEAHEIEKHAANKLVEHICLEYLLNFIARQSQLYTPEEAAEKLLDGMMVNILMEQLNAVQVARNSTIDNKPLRKHQEKLFTDVTTDVLLEELTKSLDEDMEDLDEYEQGLWDPATAEPPEWAKNDIK